MLSLFEMSLGIQVLVNQLPAEAEGEGTADAIAKAGNTALTGMDLDGKFPAPLGRHRPLHVLGHARYETAVIVEFLGAVGDLYADVFSDELVVSYRRHPEPDLSRCH